MVVGLLAGGPRLCLENTTLQAQVTNMRSHLVGKGRLFRFLAFSNTEAYIERMANAAGLSVVHHRAQRVRRDQHG